MKKILVTGASGFIGSHLCESLVDSGYEVTAFIRYNSRNDWGWLEQSKFREEIRIIRGDVRDYDSVFDSMRKQDTVFHLAALIGIPYSYVSPLAYLRTNIEGTYNVLEASRKLEVSNVIITSTSETYGSAQYVPIDEKHPLVGQSPYSASKISADQLAISYFRSFGLPIKIVRPFNTYGPRQSARAIIPTIISQLLNSNRLKLGNLVPTRDLTYVIDTVAGFAEIAKSEELNGEVTNIGMNKEISIGELAQKIAKLINKKLDIIEEDMRVRPNESEVNRLLCNNTKIVKTTNWKPKYDLESGLNETITWLRNNIEKYKVDIYNV